MSALSSSRERLASSELARSGQAWRLWAACAASVEVRGAASVHMTTLAQEAGVHRTKAGPILRRFNELGVFSWEPAARGSHEESSLAFAGRS